MTGKISLWALLALLCPFSIGSCFGQSAATRQVTPSIEFLQDTSLSRAILGCSQRTHFDYDRGAAFYRCIEPFLSIHALYENPPTITMVELDAIEKKAANDLVGKLTDFICKGVWKSFSGSQQKDNCSGEEELRPNLFFELLPAEGSSPTMVTLKIYGSSLELAAKKPDYWEFHRVSFQVPPISLPLKPDSYVLVASVFDSRLQKNRDNVRHIAFDEVMPTQYDRDVSEFLDKILASLSLK